MKLRFTNKYALILLFILSTLIFFKSSFKKSDLEEKLGEKKYTELVNIINSKKLISENELNRINRVYSSNSTFGNAGHEVKVDYKKYFDYESMGNDFRQIRKPNSKSFNDDLVGLSIGFYFFTITISILLLISIVSVENKISNQIKDNNNNIDELGKFKKYKEVL
jgi:hypothetical protein